MESPSDPELRGVITHDPVCQIRSRVRFVIARSVGETLQRGLRGPAA
ncbi:hypothetical protein ACFV2H_52725 [Streptomyces sp. NPDC059629]